MSFARLLRRCASRRFATVATSEKMPTSKTFYKRVLPPTGVAFSSPRGQEIFKDALGNDMVRVERRSGRVAGGGAEPDLPRNRRTQSRSLTRGRSLARTINLSQLNVRVPVTQR